MEEPPGGKMEGPPGGKMEGPGGLEGTLGQRWDYGGTGWGRRAVRGDGMEGRFLRFGKKITIHVLKPKKSYILNNETIKRTNISKMRIFINLVFLFIWHYWHFSANLEHT